MFDDGYIYLHVVQNILAGNGPVFNAGQRVEVFTGPLWTAILAIAGFATPFPLEWIAVVLGIVMTLAGVSLALFGSTRMVRPVSNGAFLLPLGAVVFVAVCPVWTYATLGLETGLTFLWLGSCLAILVRWAQFRRLGRWALIVLGLGPLVRPELLIDTVVFLAVILASDWQSSSWRARLHLVAWAAALPLAYQVFRMGYYGEVVANPAIAKEATLPRAGRGLSYVLDFVRPYWLIVPAIALVAGAFVPLGRSLHKLGTRQFWTFLALPAAGLLDASYIALMGGDYIHGRLLMPAFFAICAPVAAVPVARRYVISLFVLPWALVAGLSLRPPAADIALQPPFWFSSGQGQVTPAELGWSKGGSYLRWYRGPGLYLDFGFLPGQMERVDPPVKPAGKLPTVSYGPIGTVAYVLGTNVDVFDFLGLADPLTGHLELKRRGRLTGHEKPLPMPWVAAVLSVPGSPIGPFDALQSQRLNQFATPLIAQTSGRQFEIQTAWARAALACPSIHSLEYGQDGRLTVGGFLSNLVHSLGNSTVRIPPDPETAYHRFCGPGTPPAVASAQSGSA